MPKVAALGHVTLMAQDPKGLAEFYADLFGMDITGHSQTWNVAFLCSEPETKPKQDHQIAFATAKEMSHVAFYVNSLTELRAFHTKLVEQHIPVRAMMYGIGVALIFRDPEGNGLEVTWLHNHDCVVPYSRSLPLGELTDTQVMDLVQQLPTS